ncbi:MAG: hypothetical protein J7J86_04010 [Bacteroidales bacterium]|nr:hypothetical protein [Bacteroidales bacterium]
MVSATTQLKILSPDGKKRLSDMLDYNGIIALGKEFPSKKANRFIEWFTYSENSTIPLNLSHVRQATPKGDTILYKTDKHPENSLKI